MRTDGQLFAPPNQWFVGVQRELDHLGMGRELLPGARRLAQAEAAALDARTSSARSPSRSQTTAAQTDAAAVAVDVAQQAIASAEEAYRVTQALAEGRLGDDHRPSRRAVGVLDRRA